MYGESKQVKVAKLYKIYNATNSVLTIDWLEGDTAYAIGRLNDQVESVIKSVGKIKAKLDKEYQTKIKALAEVKDEEEQKKQAEEILEWYNQEKENINEKEETVGIPKFRLSQFVCKADFKTNVSVTDNKGKETVEVKEFKKGQILVPQIFMNLMGDLIDKD
jgi:vacuolar-type H+-ATPase subunit I/STV1